MEKLWWTTGSEHLQNCSSSGKFWSAVVSVYQKRWKEGTVVNHHRVIGGQGSLMHVVSGWPAWSDPTDELLLLKLLKKLMLVLIQRCQKTQCITVCCVWSCRASHQSGCPCWPLSTAKSTNNGHMSIRTGPRSNGRRWPGLLNHVFFYITWAAGWLCVIYLGNTWHQDALCEEGKPVEAVWWFGQCSAWKPWVVLSMWTHTTTYLSIAADHVHPFMETVFPDVEFSTGQAGPINLTGPAGSSRKNTQMSRVGSGLGLPPL